MRVSGCGYMRMRGCGFVGGEWGAQCEPRRSGAIGETRRSPTCPLHVLVRCSTLRHAMLRRRTHRGRCQVHERKLPAQRRSVAPPPKVQILHDDERAIRAACGQPGSQQSAALSQPAAPSQHWPTASMEYTPPLQCSMPSLKPSQAAKRKQCGHSPTAPLRCARQAPRCPTAHLGQQAWGHSGTPWGSAACACLRVGAGVAWVWAEWGMQVRPRTTWPAVVQPGTHTKACSKAPL